MYKTILLFIFKLLSAGFTALLLAFIGQVLISYSYFSFMFVFLSVFFAFLRLVTRLRFIGVLCVDLLFILALLALRIYVFMADKA